MKKAKDWIYIVWFALFIIYFIYCVTLIIVFFLVFFFILLLHDYFSAVNKIFVCLRDEQLWYEIDIAEARTGNTYKIIF